MFKRQPATAHLTVKSKTQTKNKTPANTKRKILKSGSTDTLVSEPQSRPSKSFLELLNAKASIIQKWYRRVKRKSSCVNAYDNVNVKKETTILIRDDATNLDNAGDLGEQERIERRRLLAEKTKAEILDELTIKLTLLNNIQNAEEIGQAHASHLEDQSQGNRECLEESEKEQDIRQTVEAVKSYYGTDLPEFPAVKFQYEDDFDTYDPNEDTAEPRTAALSVQDGVEEIVPELIHEEFPASCIDIDEMETYIEKIEQGNDQDIASNKTVDVCLTTNCIPDITSNTISQLALPKEAPVKQDESSSSIPVEIKRKSNYESSRKDAAANQATNTQTIIPKALVSINLKERKDYVTLPREESEKAKPRKGIESPRVKFVSKIPEQENEKVKSISGTPDQVGDRVTRILDFLKSVEEESTASVTPPKPTCFAELLKDQPLNVPESSGEFLFNSAAVFEGVKTKIMQLQMEVDSKRKTIEALKSELTRNKEIAKEEMVQHQKSLKSQLSLQRKEYETIVKRHLTFIDKVLAEKEEISKKSVELTEQVKNLDSMYQEKLKNMEESQQRDLKQHREMWQAAEKIKRDKWIQEKTKSIKDQTVQGLEPEIQKLIAQHKVQLRQAEEGYREALAKEKAQLIEQHQRQIEQMRDKHISERQKACEEEREFSRQRYMKQLEREEMEFQQQKRKLLSEFADERMRLNEAAKDNLKNEETLRKRALDSLRKEMEQERIDRDNMMTEQSKKHMAEMNQLREKCQIEKEEWQANYMKKVELSVRAKEKQFKEQLIQQRDAEIEMVIQRLECETGSNNSDATRRYRMDIERIKSETAEEIKQLRDQHSMALDKLLLSQQQVAELQASLRECQKEILQLQHSNLSKDGMLKKQKQELERLNGDESSLISQLKSEHEQELLLKMQEITQLKQTVNALEVKLETNIKSYTERLEKIENDKDETIGHVEKQVVQALRAKDDYIGKLKGQLEEAIQRATHLETLIEQQRSELLGSL
ncbi:Centrosomal protein of 131 kDa [Boothiomyces sp. JEL0866]|nr:Centrosomal protein of 131 kDa [Boothiomyces sp. JEL0866]